MKLARHIALFIAVIPTATFAQTDVEVVFRVNMNVQMDLGRFDPDTQLVVVRGTMNAWGCSVEMRESDDLDGVWELEIQMPAHAIGTGEFKFNINCAQGAQGRWEDSIGNRQYQVTGTEADEDGDGFGEIVLPTVFFDDVEDGTDVEIRFQVDMNAQIAGGRFHPDQDFVVVRGGFNSWDCTESMSDPDGDGVYELEVESEGHSIGTVGYKFNISCSDQGWEDSIGNRLYTVTGNEPDADRDGLLDIEPPVVFFDDVVPGPNVEILFRVDMSERVENKSFVPDLDQVVVAGTFSGWECSEPFEEIDENIWQLELRRESLPEGVHEYKFNINCTDDLWEMDIPNRTILLHGAEPDEDGDGYLEIIPAVAIFNSVEAQAANVNLVFRVDLSVEIARGRFDPETQSVFVRGDFLDWNCSPPLSASGDGIYEIEIPRDDAPLGLGEFKFNIDCSDGGWEDLIPNRRYFITGDEEDIEGDGYLDVFLDTVLFNDLDPIEPKGVGPFLRGDCDQTRDVSISDGIRLLANLFGGVDNIACRAACDADGDGALDISTAVYIFQGLFLGGPQPVAPTNECGVSDAKGDASLGCEEPEACA